MSIGTHHACFSGKRLLAQRTVAYTLISDVELHFQPGQFISIQVGIDAQGLPILRSYSIAAFDPKTRSIDLIVKTHGQGVGTGFLDHLQQGDRVRFTGPMGFFVNDIVHYGDVVYAATGTGIAPIYLMLEELLLRRENHRIYLFWGVRQEEDLFYHHELSSAVQEFPHLTVRRFVSNPPNNYSGETGRILVPIAEQLPCFESPTFYLCGNGQMIQALKQVLVERGIHRKKQIRTEAFFD